MAKALTVTPDVRRGVVRVQASGVPAGTALVTRQAGRVPEPIRGGDLVVSTGGFILEDPEPPFGVDLTYRATIHPTDRHIQSNRILNPKAALNTTNWTAGTDRTLTRETSAPMIPPRDAVTSLKVGPRGGGAAGVTERTLVSTVPSGFGPGRWWLTGQVYYDSPDIWSWQDVKDNGTWQDAKDEGTWDAIRTHSTIGQFAPFATLHAAVLSPTDTVVVAPFQVLGVQATSGNEWHTFQAWVDVPVGAPAGSRLVLLQGNVAREFAMTWWLTTVMLTPEAEVDAGAILPYFDGDTVLASRTSNPADNLVPGYNWTTVVSDASMTWNGTANASVSIFTGPSVIASQDTTRIDTPGTDVLDRHRLPIMLSDPILPSVSVWFELVEIGDLTFAARQQLFDVIARGPQIAVSSARAWASGELRLMTYTLAAASVAERMFAPGRILFLRNPDPDFPESLWYLAVGDVNQGRVSPVAAKKPERLWRVPFVRVERPVGLIAAASGISWSDIKNNYTWEELRMQRDDWLDAAVTPA